MIYFGKGIATALMVVLFSFLSNFGYADTLVLASDIYYHSDFEEEVFSNILRDEQNNYLALYLAGDSTVNRKDYDAINRSLQLLVEKYKDKKYQKLKDAKKVKKIYLDVHESLLDKYDQTKSFSSIFSKGEYQCVTASMLYSLVFSELSIPFEIKLLPSHTYIVAYPDDYYILVETTDPVKGTVVFDDHFKVDYINFLREQKLISSEDYESGNVEELFDQYYMEPATIDQKQLAGTQYFNLSLVAMANREFLTAYHLMEKAYLLQPSSKNTFMLLYALANAVDQMSVNESAYSEYLGKLMRFQNKGINADQLFGLFSNLTNRQLLFDGNTKLYDESYVNVISEVNDSSLRADIKFLYNYERGRTLYLSGEYSEAEAYVNEAFLLKPNSADVKAMFFGIMLAKMEEIKQGDEAYSLAKFEAYFDNISSLKTRFTQLDNMKGFRQAWLFFCLGLMDQFYQFKDAENGEKYRMIFESDYPIAISGYAGINHGIANAYRSAAAYYIQNSNMPKSLEVTNKGLNYLPDDSSLVQFKKQLSK